MQVVAQVIEATQGQCGAIKATFSGVVVNHIQNYFQASLVQGGDHVTHFIKHCLGAAFLGGLSGVGGLRGKVRQGGVTPVVAKATAG